LDVRCSPAIPATAAHMRRTHSDMRPLRPIALATGCWRILLVSKFPFQDRFAIHDRILDGTAQPADLNRSLGALLRLGVLCLSLGAFLMLSLRSGHLFNEDYAIYLQQSLNIVHGHVLDDMGIVYFNDTSLDLAEQAPRVYPTGAPLLYALPVML